MQLKLGAGKAINTYEIIGLWILSGHLSNHFPIQKMKTLDFRAF